MAVLTKAILGTVVAAGTAIAHSHVNNLVIDGVYWQGYDPTTYPYESNPPIVVGWTAADTDNGFVAPDAYQSGDIICHKNATPAGGHATVNAGDSISIQWAVPWPDSHKGPVLDYLAPCNGNCETVDKTTLQFFKIDQGGYINGSNPGTWTDDILIADASTWLVQIPEDIAPGNYVLRHEIIALHSAQSADGAQNYPQCFNLVISGTGTLSPSGTYGTDLYQATDPGILYNIYVATEDYTIPGPTLYSGFPSSIAQSSSVATVTSSAIVPGSGGSTGSTTSVKSTSVTTTGSTSTPTTSSVSKTTTTTLITSTTPSPTTTSPATGGQTLYGQCGGSSWTGPTSCASGTCTTQNPYYAQCL